MPVIVAAVVLFLLYLLAAKVVRAIGSFFHNTLPDLLVQTVHVIAWGLVVVAAAAIMVVLLPALWSLVEWLWQRRQPPPAATRSGLTFCAVDGSLVSASQYATPHPPVRVAAPDPIEHLMLSARAFVDPEPLTITPTTLRVQAWSSEVWRKSTSTTVLLEAHRARVTVPAFDLDARGYDPAVVDAAEALVDNPGDGRLGRMLVDALTQSDFDPERPVAELSVTVVRLVTEHGCAPVRSFLHLATTDLEGRPIALGLTDRLTEGDGEEESDSSWVQDLSQVFPPPWKRGASEASNGVHVGDWAAALRQSDVALLPSIRAARAGDADGGSAVGRLRPVVRWQEPSTVAVTPPSTPSRPVKGRGQAPVTPSVPDPRACRRGLGPVVRVPTEVPPTADPAGRAIPLYLEVGAQAHQKLRSAGIGRLVSKHSVSIKDSGTVAIGNNCTIKDTAHFHLRKVTLDWSHWKAAAGEMRGPMRKLMADPGDRDALRRVREIAAAYTPAPEDRHATTTARSVRGDSELRLRKIDVVSVGDNARLEVGTDYTIEESRLPVVGLMADNPDMILSYVKSLIEPSARSEFLARALNGIEASGDDSLLNAARGLDVNDTSLWSLFGLERVSDAATVTIGVGNLTEHYHHLHVGRSEVGVEQVSYGDPDVESVIVRLRRPGDHLVIGRDPWTGFEPVDLPDVAGPEIRGPGIFGPGL